MSRKLFYFFPVLFCFCLPFGSLLLSLIVVMWTITSFFNFGTFRIRPALKQPVLWLFWIFFAMTLLSALFSSDRGEAVFSVEVKMTFLIFPYLLFCFSWPPQILRRCVVGFVSGCFFASLYLILRAFLYALNGQPEYFFYTDFSDFIHASYFSMYLVLALVFVALLYPRWFRHQRSVIYSSYFFAAIFCATIFLCNSKLGIISFFVCLMATVFYIASQRYRARTILTLVAGLLVFSVLLVRFVPSLFSRFKSIGNLEISRIDKATTESTAVRVLIWQQCLDLIGEHLWFGTGVADANNALYRKYEEQGISGAGRLRLNAHNQYFQTFIGMGLPGFLSLLSLTLFQVVVAVYRRKILLFLFSLLVSLNFLVESMLQASAGVLFFAFFLCFIALNDAEDLSEDAKMDL